MPLPESNRNSENDFTEISSPSKDFKLDFKNRRIIGFTDDSNAIEQASRVILQTERYSYVIYPQSWGVEFEDLFGKHPAYAAAELARRITDALLQDDRIITVSDFEFQRAGRSIYCQSAVSTKYGVIPAETEVNI